MKHLKLGGPPVGVGVDRVISWVTNALAAIDKASQLDMEQVILREYDAAGAYTPTRTLDVSTATINDIINFLATLIGDVKGRGSTTAVTPSGVLVPAGNANLSAALRVTASRLAPGDDVLTLIHAYLDAAGATQLANFLEVTTTDAGVTTVTIPGPVSFPDFEGDGTYTPTLFNTTNVSASSVTVDSRWVRNGKHVSGSAWLSVDPVTIGINTVISWSPPVPSDFAATIDAWGVGHSYAITAQEGWVVTADPTNNRLSASCIAASIANHAIHLAYNYVVIP